MSNGKSELRQQALTGARRAVECEAQALAELAGRLGSELLAAVELIDSSSGRVIVTGLGKSGHVGRKIAATLSSVGVPSSFLHAAEALHGDSGMVSADDVVIAISNSGETVELCVLTELVQSRGVPVIAMTGQAGSRLSQSAAVVLDISVACEADPHDLVPTASTTVTMALGDALAVALMVWRSFGPDDFAAFHPGGSLGQRLGASDPTET